MTIAKSKRAPHLTSTEPQKTITDSKCTAFQASNAQPERRQTLKKILAEVPGNSGAAQRERILRAMRETGSITTFEAMRYLDCFDPRPRIFELRRDGYAINTIPIKIRTESGVTHRIGLYSILPAQIKVPAHRKMVR